LRQGQPPFLAAGPARPTKRRRGRRSLDCEHPTTPPCGTSAFQPTSELISRLLERGIDAVAGLHRIYCTPLTSKVEGGAWMPELVRKWPEFLTGLGVVGAELTVVGAACEHQIAGWWSAPNPIHRVLNTDPAKTRLPLLTS